jgi:uncharacterized protein with ParB-like and HNH nuclease domain
MDLQNLRFNPYTVKSLFDGNRKFYVPAFQRRYQWSSNSDKRKDRNVNYLLEDIVLAQKADGYFLGPILTYEDKSEKKNFHLVDGQQRFTTLLLYFCVYRKYIQELAFKQDEIKYVEECIFTKVDRESKPERILRTSHIEGDIFLDKLVNDTDFDIESKEFEKVPRLVDAYKSIMSFLKSDNRNTQENIELFDFICEHVFVTEMVADDFSQAFTIFDRMNDRGLTLSESDKIKHLLLSNIARKGQAYFDKESTEVNKAWEEITDDIAATNTEMDDFLRYFFMAHYWTDRYRNKNEILPWLKDDKNTLGQKIIFNPDDFLKELRKSTDQFVKFRNGNDIEGAKGKYNHSISALKTYYRSNRQHYPILLAASKLKNIDEFKKVCILVDSVIVVMSWAEEQWNQLESLLPKLCVPLNKGDFATFEKRIRSLINEHKENATQRMVDPEYLELYYKDKKGLSNHLIHKFEYQLQFMAKDTYVPTSRDTVEHILEKDNMATMERAIPDKKSLNDYLNLRYRIGNQTIWKKVPNSSSANKTPEEKFNNNLFQGSSHMSTNIIVNGDLESKPDEDSKNSFNLIKKYFNITGPEKLTSSKFWTKKNVLNREKYMFYVISQALLTELNPHNEKYTIKDIADWEDVQFKKISTYSNIIPDKEVEKFNKK